MSKVISARPIAVANSLVDKRLVRYDKMMRRRPGAERDVTPATCKECAYHHPEWEHRCCLYACCKYGKDIDVFKRH